jgi:2-aminoadipate transaminase
VEKAASSSASPANAADPWGPEGIRDLVSARYTRVPPGPATNTLWAQPGSISLAGGVPDPDSLPIEQIRQAYLTVLEREPKPALEYGPIEGFAPLRDYVATLLCAEPGVNMTAENVTLTSGSSHSLSNIVDTFIDPGDVILVEQPTFLGALRTFLSGGARVVGIPMDDDGLETDRLDATLSELEREGRKVKFLYTIPTFQNPAGMTMTLERRQALVEIAERHRLLVVEDDPYSRLRFRGETLPSLFSMMGGKGVLGVGTFSKLIATGLRAAWVIGEKPLIDALISTRYDAGSSQLTERMIAAYIEAGYLEPQIERLINVYRDKCDTMLNALDERCAGYLSYARPEGGYFIWARLPEGLRSPDFARLALSEGVSIVPGITSMTEPELGFPYIRLAFSYVPQQDIFEAIQRLGRALEKATHV